MDKTTSKRRIRVLRTIESFYPYVSGPANQASRISKGLEKREIRSPILTSNYKAEKSPKHERMGGVEVYRFPIRWKFMKYFYTPSMKRMLTDFDIVHAHSYRGYQTGLAYKMARRMGKPFVISTHGSLLGYSHHLKGIMKLPYLLYDLFGGKKLIRYADAIIVNSKEEYKDAKDYGINKDRIHLVPVGVNIDEYSPLEKETRSFKVLFVGRISRNRNVEPIIKAAAIIKQKLPKKKIKFRIVGGEEKSSDTSKSGYLEELKILAKELDVSDMVEFTGPKYDEELRKEYRTAHIFVYTSLSENFGQTMLEAGAAGLPMICTKVGIAPEIITSGKNGFLVKGEPEEIANRITELFGKEKRERFGALTREKVRKNFNWDEIIDKYLEIYKKVLKKN
jgi:glycosyltransferase involved in cell wall biosynthesis